MSTPESMNIRGVVLATYTGTDVTDSSEIVVNINLTIPPQARWWEVRRLLFKTANEAYAQISQREH